MASGYKEHPGEPSLEQHLSPFPLITPVLWALSLQSQMTMTLSDTTIKIALRDLCQGWGIGNDRGLFEFFSFLDLKIKELKRMETANWKMLAGFLPWAGMCLLLFFCLLLQWDLPCWTTAAWRHPWVPLPRCCVVSPLWLLTMLKGIQVFPRTLTSTPIQTSPLFTTAHRDQCPCLRINEFTLAHFLSFPHP